MLGYLLTLLKMFLEFLNILEGFGAIKRVIGAFVCNQWRRDHFNKIRRAASERTEVFLNLPI